MLNANGLIDSINETYIALIPKLKSTTKVSNFRCISLFNVIYKIVSKTMANRFKLVLNDIIAPTQYKFVLGRLISDNIIMAYEAMHIMNSRLIRKSGYMALKLDPSKAYDKIEWAFLRTVLKKSGFPQR